MAKLPALVSAIAEVDGRERKAIDHVARVIREAGYIPTAGRGGAAANMSPREAANLLIALNGADTPGEAGVAIDRYRSLEQAWSHADDRAAHIEAVNKIVNASTFGQALEDLIEATPSLVLSLHQYWRDAYNVSDPDQELFWTAFGMDMFGLDLTLKRYSAEFELFTMNGDERRVQFEAVFIRDNNKQSAGFYGASKGDRRVSITIGVPTFYAAWRGVHAEDEPSFPTDLEYGAVIPLEDSRGKS